MAAVMPAQHGRGTIVALLLAGLGVLPGSARADDSLGFTVVRHGLSPRLCAGEKTTTVVELRNDGMVPWSNVLGDRLAYHWLRDEAVVVSEGRRTGVGGMVMPGASTELRARIEAPQQAGRYTLQWAMVRDRVRWFPEPDDARVEIEVVDGGAPLAWSVELLEAPVVAAGEPAELRVRVHNHGCAAWSASSADAFAYHWIDADGRMIVREGVRTPMPEVPAGGEAELRVRIDGPPQAGAHVLQLEPVREHASWYGPPVAVSEAAIAVSVADPPLAWSMRAPQVPTTGFAGGLFEIPVVVRNEGTRAWSHADGDRMGYRWYDEAGKLLALEGVRTPWPAAVAPGDEIESMVRVELPSIPGRYQLRLQPVREGVRWLGPPSDDLAGSHDAAVIEVGPPQLGWSIVRAQLPGRMWVDRTTLVPAVLRNDGADAWSPADGDRVSYRWRDADGNLGLEGMRTELPGPVAPGESIALQVRVHAPREVGSHALELAMVREHVSWFPAPSQGDAHAEIRVVRFGIIASLGAVLAIVMLGLALRQLRAPRHRAIAAALWAPACVIAATWALGESFADLSGVEAWAGTRFAAASSAAWCALPVALVPVRWRPHAASLVLIFAFSLALVDLGYLDFFGSIVPLSAVAALHHLGDAHATVFSLWHPQYATLAIPLLVLVPLWTLHPPRPRARSTAALAIVLASLCVLAVPSWRGLHELASSPIGARVFSERDNVGRLGLWNAHLFEAGRTLSRWIGADALSPPERARVAAFFAARVAERPQPHPLAPGANLVVIQIEAMQSWVVDAEIDGQRVMPFLHGADAEAMHFTRVFDQTAQGRTSDAEYLLVQSSHPLRTGALSFLRAENHFDTIAHRLADAGYATLSAHPYARGFWNRAVVHPRYGFARSYFREELGPGPQIGWGLCDAEFLARMAEVLRETAQPSFGFFVTLSVHHPYADFPAPMAELELGELDGTPLGNYLQGMRHADGALRGFFARLHDANLLDHTVVLVYGDHVAGLPSTPELRALSGIDRWDPSVPVRTHLVPALLWIPGAPVHGRDDRLAGHVDLGPTVLDALGVAASPSMVGRSLLGPRDDRIIALPDGSAIADDRFWVARGRDQISGGGCFDPDGRARARGDCSAIEAAAAEELWAARAVLDHDLHRSALDPLGDP
jgi:phosphoglycerol transferase MdoB-like AlkP superfamily enzyme